MNTSPSNILDSINGIKNLDSFIDYSLDKANPEDGAQQELDRADQIIASFNSPAPTAGAIQDGKMPPEQLAEFDAKRAKTQEEFDNANRNFQEQRGALGRSDSVTEPAVNNGSLPPRAPVVAPAVDPRNNPNPMPFADQTIAPEEKVELEKKAEETASKIPGTTIQEKLDNLSKVLETKMSEVQKVKYNQLSPEQSKNVQLRFFLSLMEHSSKPGATFVGAAGAAGREALDAKRVITQQNNQNQEKRYARNIANIKDVTKMGLEKIKLAVDEKRWAAQLERYGGKGTQFMADENNNAYIVGKNGVAIAVVTDDGKPLKMKKTTKEDKREFSPERVRVQSLVDSAIKAGKMEEGEKVELTGEEIDLIRNQYEGQFGLTLTPARKTKFDFFIKDLPNSVQAEAKKIYNQLTRPPESSLPMDSEEEARLKNQLKDLYKQNNIPYPL